MQTASQGAEPRGLHLQHSPRMGDVAGTSREPLARLRRCAHLTKDQDIHSHDPGTQTKGTNNAAQGV